MATRPDLQPGLWYVRDNRFAPGWSVVRVERLQDGKLYAFEFVQGDILKAEECDFIAPVPAPPAGTYESL